MYKRILLKISGEALAGENKVGINSKAVGEICDRIKETRENEKEYEDEYIQKGSRISANQGDGNRQMAWQYPLQHKSIEGVG